MSPTQTEFRQKNQQPHTGHQDCRGRGSNGRKAEGISLSPEGCPGPVNTNMEATSTAGDRYSCLVQGGGEGGGGRREEGGGKGRGMQGGGRREEGGGRKGRDMQGGGGKREEGRKGRVPYLYVAVMEFCRRSIRRRVSSREQHSSRC